MSQYLPLYLFNWNSLCYTPSTHKQMCLCVYPQRWAHINTLTHSSRGRHLHHYPIRNYIRGPLPTRTWVGEEGGGGGREWRSYLSCRANRPGTLRDKIQVNFLSFRANTDNLRPQYFCPEKVVEIRPRSCAIFHPILWMEEAGQKHDEQECFELTSEVYRSHNDLLICL